MAQVAWAVAPHIWNKRKAPCPCAVLSPSSATKTQYFLAAHACLARTLAPVEAAS